MQKRKVYSRAIFFLAALMTISIGCSQPLTKREKAGLVGGGIGAASGAIIGSTTGHAGTGALIGGPIGLLAGALIGDQLMAQIKDKISSKDRSTRIGPKSSGCGEKSSGYAARTNA